jgi:hypothetical protein
MQLHSQCSCSPNFSIDIWNSWVSASQQWRHWLQWPKQNGQPCKLQQRTMSSQHSDCQNAVSHFQLWHLISLHNYHKARTWTLQPH